ncbi:MAG: hypothetical protein JWR69_2215, partial [Pedosphaera sp.]|nr:hypothetical protein [Pedosphaera sp.]
LSPPFTGKYVFMRAMGKLHRLAKGVHYKKVGLINIKSVEGDGLPTVRELLFVKRRTPTTTLNR